MFARRDGCKSKRLLHVRDVIIVSIFIFRVGYEPVYPIYLLTIGQTILIGIPLSRLCGKVHFFYIIQSIGI